MGDVEPELSASPWLILAVLILTIGGFVGSTFYAHQVAAKVDEDASSIATNAAPAIEHLAAARGEVSRMALAAARLSSPAVGAGSDAQTLTDAYTRLRAHLAGYLEQPFYPKEQPGYAAVDRAAHELQGCISAARAATANDGRGLPPVVLGALLSSIGQVDAALGHLVVFNAGQQNRMGLEILRRRRRAHRIGYVLQACTAVLSLFLMSLVIRGVRQYGRLLGLARAAIRARDDVVAAVSHDLKNPIHTIGLSAGALRRGSADPIKVEQNVARIERSVERMRRLIEDLLDAARIEAGQLTVERKPEDAAQMVGAAVELLRPVAEDKSLRLVAGPLPEAAEVSCERHLVLRVFTNLIGNAIKFSPRGGSVFVTAEIVQGQVRFTVRDEGPGIPAALRAHVFDRYWQQKPGERRGSGLGLYIAKGIVEAHGGRIWFESPARGTTVSFTLPVVVRAGTPDGPGAARANVRA